MSGAFQGPTEAYPMIDTLCVGFGDPSATRKEQDTRNGELK